MYETSFWDFDFLVEYSENNYWKNTTSRFHYHNVYEIYYLMENEIIYCIDNKLYHLKPGSLVIIPPEVIHTTSSINDKIRKRFLLYLPEDFVKCFLEDESDLLSGFPNKPFLITGSRKNNIEDLFFKLLNEYERKSSSVVMKKSILGELLVSLKRIAVVGNTANHSSALQFDSNGQISKIVRYISNHFESNISLNSLSELFFLNPTYISRTFKEQLGLSFTEYLKSVRVREAINLLKNTDYDMSKIASKTGFANSTSFCRVFKSAVGISPLQYRKNQKKTSD